jgi:hypothetical protein
MHERCAVYTAAPVAARLLDVIGWSTEADLGDKVLLEPCVGEGAILLEAVRRLISSLRARQRPISRRVLAPRIKGFELHPGTVATARRNVQRLLLCEGLCWSTAAGLAEEWVREGDFLLASPGIASHVAANPPYVRWSRLPQELATEYRRVLRPIATRGDVVVAFLDKMLEWANHGGRIAALVSDRWMFAQYGADFVKDATERGWILEVVDERPDAPFVKEVGAYSAIVRLGRGCTRPAIQGLESRAAARSLHHELVAKHGTMEEAGCRVRVGPALGSGRTFLVDAGQAANIEEELVWPYVGREDLIDGEARSSKLRAVVPYDRAGSLIEIQRWPLFATWIDQHEQSLKGRSHFRADERWWRTIDAIGVQWRESPKLLLPELCRKPVCVVDRTGGLPAHSLYAIWPGEWPIEPLRRVLNTGLLRITAEAHAPMLKQGWYRFYKRFIVRTPLPAWRNLAEEHRVALAGDGGTFESVFSELFGFAPDR